MFKEIPVQPCTQENRITNIEKNVLEISAQATNIAHSVDLLVQKLDPIIEKVQEHDRALRGSNGDMGIVAKVASMSDTVNSLHVTIKGKDEDAGLVGDVSEIGKTIKEWADNQRWLFRLVVGWLVTTILGALAYLITNLPK
jgi:hypothetical protein